MTEENRIIRVALAEDDAEDREFFQEVLEQLPVNVALTLYNNGLELVNGLASGVEKMPDIVFLDLNMPIMNGIQALEEIRKKDEFKRIPIIAIYSTSTSPKDQIDTFNLGADAYISKPNDYKVLKSVLQKVLEIDWQNWDRSKGNYLIEPN